MTYDSRWWTPAGGCGALTSQFTASGAERSHYSNYWPNQYYSSKPTPSATDLSTAGGFYSSFPMAYPLTSQPPPTFDLPSSANSSVPTSSCQFYGGAGAPVHPEFNCSPAQLHFGGSDGSSVGSTPSPVAPERGYFKSPADSCGQYEHIIPFTV